MRHDHGLIKQNIGRRGTVGGVRRRGRCGRRASDRTKARVQRFGVRFGREEQVACHASALALAMTDDEARREAEM